MTNKDIYELLEPINELIGDTCEWRKNNHEKQTMGSNNYLSHDLLLWYNPNTNDSIRIWLHEKNMVVRVENNDNSVLFADINREEKDFKEYLYLLIDSYKIRRDYLTKMFERNVAFGKKELPTDFMRKRKIESIL